MIAAVNTVTSMKLKIRRFALVYLAYIYTTPNINLLGKNIRTNGPRPNIPRPQKRKS